jgi:thiol-disulfide isomerase/thioredoxin
MDKRNRRVASWLGLCAALFAVGGAARAAGLGPGDAAPKLALKGFLKGEPVTELTSGKTYVVEFWATWCGPCRASIPHLTEMAHQYKAVTFIGVDVWEQDPAAAAPFVKEMGDKMDYHVAQDDNGAMAATWMKAAGQDGIPCAFIVGGDGNIAWIGHPMAMAPVLAKVVAGQWDAAKARGEAQLTAARNAKLAGVEEQFRAAKDPAGQQKVLRDALDADPTLADPIGLVLLQSLMQSDRAAATTLALRLIDMPALQNNAMALNYVAWDLVGGDPPNGQLDAAVAAAALRAARRADQVVGGKEAAIADTLGMAYFRAGDLERAVETQQRAAALVENDPNEAKEIRDHLARFQTALAAAPPSRTHEIEARPGSRL